MSDIIPNNNETVMKEDDFIVSKTDTKGRITYGNKIFIDFSGYKESELLGQPHSIVRHPDMPKAVFKLLWDQLQKKDEIFAYVKNLRKDGGFYWVVANVTVSLDAGGNTIGYYSVRRKPTKEALDIIVPLYEKLKQLESGGGLSASMDYLTNLLKEKGVSYEEFILSI